MSTPPSDSTLVRRTALAAALVLLAAAPCLAVAADDADSPPADETIPGGGKDERVVLPGDKADLEPWRLPPNYRRPDGSFDQAKIVARQKERLPVLNERLGARLRLAETDHYLLFTDADAPTAEKFVAWCETIYANLGRQFGIPADERVWDGKCILMIFRSRPLYESHARAFDSCDARATGAYFAWEARAPGEPQLVHISIPLDTRDERRLRELFAHEGTHAFFQLYKRTVDLPRWLHEGLAEYMTVVNDPSLRSRKIQWSRHLARTGRTIRDVLHAPPDGTFAYPAYSVSFTLVEFLLSAGRPKFRRFIERLKDGADQDDALREAYGFGLADLERRWVIYVKEYVKENG